MDDFQIGDDVKVEFTGKVRHCSENLSFCSIEVKLENGLHDTFYVPKNAIKKVTDA